MPKTEQPTKHGRRPYYSTQPWECRHHKNTSELVAHVEASGNLEKVLTVHSTSGASAETMAEYLLKLINDSEHNQHVLRFALTNFEFVLESGGKVDFTSEQDVERSIKEIKQIVG